MANAKELLRFLEKEQDNIIKQRTKVLLEKHNKAKDDYWGLKRELLKKLFAKCKLPGGTTLEVSDDEISYILKNKGLKVNNPKLTKLWKDVELAEKMYNEKRTEIWDKIFEFKKLLLFEGTNPNIVAKVRDFIIK